MTAAGHGLRLTRTDIPGRYTHDSLKWRVLGTLVLLHSRGGEYWFTVLTDKGWRDTDAWLERHGLRLQEGGATVFKRRSDALEALVAAAAIEPLPVHAEPRPVTVVASETGGYRSADGRFTFQRDGTGRSSPWLLGDNGRQTNVFPSLIAARRYAAARLAQEATGR